MKNHKMKKVLLAIIIGIFVISGFQSCKKGENDPLLSLRSRKARLVGEWALKSGQLSIVYYDGTTRNYTYDGVTRIETSSTPGTITYTENVTINKDGTYQWVENIGTSTLTEEGFWSFGRKSKELDLKNKEAVFFTRVNSVAASGNTYAYTGSSILDNITMWQLDELKSKEIIVLINGSETYSATGTSTYIGTMTYEKK
jgi:hypothetical protein